MANPVKQLVEIDRQARELVAQRQAAYKGLREELAGEREELARTIRARAQRRIETMRAQARQEAQAQCAALEQRFAAAQAALCAAFAQRQRQLVEEIIAGCLGQDGPQEG